MTQMTREPNAFIRRLQELATNQDRGALAALRRGLGRPPGAAAEMFRYVEPWLPERRSADQEAAYYLIASLFALHPKSVSEGNLGQHLASIRSKGKDDEDKGDEDKDDALERRFSALLAAHPDDLPNYLRQAVSMLKSKETPINWDQLLRDVQAWDAPDRRVQKAWARAFWGKSNHTPAS